MAQPPESPTADLPAPGDPPRHMPGLPGIVFQPKSRCLVDEYLVPRALHGRVTGDAIPDAVAEGVDVYATRPEALPFPPRHRGRYCGKDSVWGYFFTARPAEAAAGGCGKYVREVAAGGRWCWCCGPDQEYDGEDGEAYAFRTRFAYYEDGGKLTPWRMMEYRLNEGAARFRGVAFHPSAKNLVVWKVYYKVEVAKGLPPTGTGYYKSDDGDENEVREPTEMELQRPRWLADLPDDTIFHPESRDLVDQYLIPRALHGRVSESDDVIQDGVAEGVDVLAVRPWALPFPSCNHGRYESDDGAIWGYFFTARPADAAAGGPGKYVRDVAAGGRWIWCGGPDKGYPGDDGEVYAFRTRFAYYEDFGKLSPWRMKEYRLNEGAARFRGVAFHPGANNLVVWKVYYKVDFAMKDRLMEIQSSDDGDESESESDATDEDQNG